MKSRPKHRKSASNSSSIIQGFFKPNTPTFPGKPTIGGFRGNVKSQSINRSRR